MKTDFWPKFESGNAYHFYNRFASDINPLREEEDCKEFLFGFKKYFGNYVDTYAYCLMPNHFHIVFRVKGVDLALLECISKEKSKAAKQFLAEETGVNDFLTDQIRRFFSSFSLKYNAKYKHRGGLFLEKTRRVLVKSEQRLQYLICYLHHNPIHHRFVENFLDWKNSSYREYVLETNPFIHKKYILDWLGDGDKNLGLKIFKSMHDDFRIDHKYFIKG